MQRKNFAATGRLHRRGPAPRARPPRLLSQLIFNTFHNCRLHALEHGGDLDLAYAAARAHNRGMLEFCSVDPRLLPTCYVPLADPERAARDRRRPRRRGPRPCWSPRAVPAVLAEPPRPLRRVGPGRRGRHPRRLPRGRHRAPDRSALLRQRPARPPRLPRRRRELPLGRLHGHPGPAGPDAGHADLRRRARGVPPAAHRGDRAGGDLGAVLAAPDGVGLRGVLPSRGATPGAVDASVGLRAPPGPVHPVPDRGRRLDRGAGRAPTW